MTLLSTAKPSEAAPVGAPVVVELLVVLGAPVVVVLVRARVIPDGAVVAKLVVAVVV